MGKHTPTREAKIENAAHHFIAEFDRYFSNASVAPAHPKFFDEAYYRLKDALRPEPRKAKGD